jgi:hypothetical protein
MLPFLRSLDAPPRNYDAEVAHRQVDREVDRLEHLHEQQIPDTHAQCECESTASLRE